MNQPAGDRNRRTFLKDSAVATVAAGALAARQAQAYSPFEPARSRSLIKNENRKEGARDWQLTRVRIDPRSGFRSPWIEGYCSRQSVAAGDKLDILVSTNPARQFSIEIFRTGYYGGRGARLMTTLGPFNGKKQPDPPVGPKRLRECRWEPATTLTIPPDWPSGVYLGRLTTLPASNNELYWQSYVVFIVRDHRPADILFQCSDNTWQAYNRWPDLYSLYDESPDKPWSSGPNVDVSFDRPYGKYRQIYDNPQSVGSGEYLCWEFPLAYWLEQHGYDVTYCSNSDLLTPERGLKCKAFLSVGHDEYWDERQYHSVKAMIEGGVNALFLSGNSVCWVTPFRPSAGGQPNRIITRAAPYGGLGRQRHPEVNDFKTMGPDEGLLMGAINVIPVNGGGDWIVVKPEHWMFKGTGMKQGDSVRGLVGWEYHGEPAKIPGLEVVAEGTALVSGTRPQHWTATIYPGPKKNFVFNAATIFWSQGLSSPPGHMLPWSHWSRPHGPDERVQRITQNLLKRAIG
ncbi:MAG: N,N-dimethylformamidase beta subunit family domain-containing protein [Verrucomicrobiota bacterium]